MIYVSYPQGPSQAKPSQASPRSAVDAVGVCIVRLSVNRPVVEQLLRPRRLSWSSPFHQQQGSSFAHIPVATTLVDPVEVAPGPSSSAPSAPSVSVRDLVPCFAPAVPYLSRLKHPIGQIFLAWHFSDPSLAAGHLVFCIASPVLPDRTVPTTRPLQLDSFTCCAVRLANS